jgi:hypothetical protein
MLVLPPCSDHPSPSQPTHPPPSFRPPPGIMSGLTLGLLSLDRLDLEVLMRSGTTKEQVLARRLLPIVAHPHWVLCTLVIVNTLAGMALPLCLDRLLNAIGALLLSTTAIVVFGEIVPQAVCSRFGMSIGGRSAPVVRALMWFTAPLSWPMGKVLDYVLGSDSSLFARGQLRALVDLHRWVGPGREGAEGGGGRGRQRAEQRVGNGGQCVCAGWGGGERGRWDSVSGPSPCTHTSGAVLCCARVRMHSVWLHAQSQASAVHRGCGCAQVQQVAGSTLLLCRTAQKTSAACWSTGMHGCTSVVGARIGWLSGVCCTAWTVPNARSVQAMTVPNARSVQVGAGATYPPPELRTTPAC